MSGATALRIPIVILRSPFESLRVSGAHRWSQLHTSLPVLGPSTLRLRSGQAGSGRAGRAQVEVDEGDVVGDGIVVMGDDEDAMGVLLLADDGLHLVEALDHGAIVGLL